MMLPNSDNLDFFDYQLPSASFDAGRFFRNIRAWRTWISVNFLIDIHFQGYLLQELDGQIQCDHFGVNLMKIGRMVS